MLADQLFIVAPSVAQKDFGPTHGYRNFYASPQSVHSDVAASGRVS